MSGKVSTRKMLSILSSSEFDRKVKKLKLDTTHSETNLARAKKIMVDGLSVAEVARQEDITLQTLNPQIIQIYRSMFAETVQVVLQVPKDDLDDVLAKVDRYVVTFDGIPQS